MSGSARHRAREYALQVLYGLDLNDKADSGASTRAWAELFELEVEGEVASFAQALVERVSESRSAIDERIQEASKNWRLERMSRVDRNILRLATAELSLEGSAPVKVVINEAVELAKAFGAEESPAFINGILDRIAQGFGTGSN